ncbi:MAG TPA: sugar diacid recognition domain-containing protein [Spirochaetales bacterium]|nr:sugar diacid recognition domain-containing protein [Spirochaetales bacterium]
MVASNTASIDIFERIVSLVHEATGHGVNIMGDGGRILASSDPTRVGTVHDGGRRVMSGEVEEVAIDADTAATLRNVKAGYMGAVRMDGKLIACIGIGGEPHEVKPLQKMAALSLKQELERERLAGRERGLLQDVRRDIGDIAERMQVLSLNGAVLAARLGEKGRGFKIVVGEMRELAAQIGEKLVELERREKNVVSE